MPSYHTIDFVLTISTKRPMAIISRNLGSLEKSGYWTQDQTSMTSLPDIFPCCTESSQVPSPVLIPINFPQQNLSQTRIAVAFVREMCFSECAGEMLPNSLQDDCLTLISVSRLGDRPSKQPAHQDISRALNFL